MERGPASRDRALLVVEEQERVANVLVRGLRAEGDVTPVLMLTAFDAIEQRVEGLRLGGDDYLTKPFAFDELLARLQALNRRNRGSRTENPVQRAGDVTFDRHSLTVSGGERAVPLTARELALLEFLMSQPGRVLSRERILSNVWGLAEDPLTNIVDVYIRRLHRKLDDPEGTLIVSMRGNGYRFDPQD